jgi:propanol-preferring alcohol dehydrogenase
MNDWAVPPMSTFGTKCAGHEGAGVVVKVGSAVQGWSVGDRGGVKPLWDVCHNCEHCYSRIPEGVSDEVAGPIMCSASTMHRALIEAGLKSGDWVVFPGGGGGVGIQGIQLAK